LGQSYAIEKFYKSNALSKLDSAITYLAKSYQLDPMDENTTLILSIYYWNKGDCEDA